MVKYNGAVKFRYFFCAKTNCNPHKTDCNLHDKEHTPHTTGRIRKY